MIERVRETLDHLRATRENLNTVLNLDPPNVAAVTMDSDLAHLYQEWTLWNEEAQKVYQKCLSLNLSVPSFGPIDPPALPEISQADPAPTLSPSALPKSSSIHPQALPIHPPQPITVSTQPTQSSSKTVVVSTSNEQHALRKELESLKESHQTLLAEHANLTKTNQRLEGEITAKAEEFESLSEKLTQNQTEIMRLQTELKTTESRLQPLIQAAKNHDEQVKGIEENFNLNIANLKRERDAASTDFKNAQEKNAKIQTQLEEKQAENKQLRETIAQLTNERDDLQKQLEQSQQTVQTQIELIKIQQQQIGDLEKQLKIALDVNQTVSQEIATLKRMNDDLMVDASLKSKVERLCENDYSTCMTYDLRDNVDLADIYFSCFRTLELGNQLEVNAVSKLEFKELFDVTTKLAYSAFVRYRRSINYRRNPMPTLTYTFCDNVKIQQHLKKQQQTSTGQPSTKQSSASSSNTQQPSAASTSSSTTQSSESASSSSIQPSASTPQPSASSSGNSSQTNTQVQQSVTFSQLEKIKKEDALYPIDISRIALKYASTLTEPSRQSSEDVDESDDISFHPTLKDLKKADIMWTLHISDIPIQDQWIVTNTFSQLTNSHLFDRVNTRWMKRDTKMTEDEIIVGLIDWIIQVMSGITSKSSNLSKITYYQASVSLDSAAFSISPSVRQIWNYLYKGQYDHPIVVVSRGNRHLVQYLQFMYMGLAALVRREKVKQTHVLLRIVRSVLPSVHHSLAPSRFLLEHVPDKYNVFDLLSFNGLTNSTVSCFGFYPLMKGTKPMSINIAYNEPFWSDVEFLLETKKITVNAKKKDKDKDKGKGMEKVNEGQDQDKDEDKKKDEKIEREIYLWKVRLEADEYYLKTVQILFFHNEIKTLSSCYPILIITSPASSLHTRLIFLPNNQNRKFNATFTFPFDTSLVRWIDFHLTGHIMDFSSIDSIAFLHYLSDCLQLSKLTHVLACYLKPLFDFYQYTPEHESLMWVNYCRTKTIEKQTWTESDIAEETFHTWQSDFNALQMFVVDQLKSSLGAANPVIADDKIQIVRNSQYYKKLNAGLQKLKPVLSIKSHYLTVINNAMVVMKWLNQVLSTKQITERSLQFLDTTNWQNPPGIQYVVEPKSEAELEAIPHAEVDEKEHEEEVIEVDHPDLDELDNQKTPILQHQEKSASNSTFSPNSSQLIPFENLSGLKVSKIQMNNLRHAIMQHDSRKKSQMIQFDMGAGKSSVILPLLVLHIFQNIRPPSPNHVRHVFLIQPDHLIPSMVKRVVTTVLPLLPNVRLFHVLHPESSFKQMIQDFQTSSSISVITDVEWKQFCLQLILRSQTNILTNDNVSISLLFDEFDSMAVPSISSFNWTSKAVPHPLYHQDNANWYQMYTDSVLKLFQPSQDNTDAFQAYLRHHFESLQSLRTNIDFGFHPIEPFAGAIPFAKANQPRVGSNFSDPDVRAILTVRLYDIYSIPRPELEQLRIDWMVVAPEEVSYQPILKVIQTIYAEKKQIFLEKMSIETRDQFLFGNNQINFNWWRHHEEVKRAVLTTKVMPAILQINPLKYTFSFLDGLQPFFQKQFDVVAFSGTGFLMELFEAGVNTPKVSFKANSELTTDQKNILRHATYEIVAPRANSDTLQLWFNAVTIRSMMKKFEVVAGQKTDPMVVCVIDAAGWACHLSIEEWVDKFREVIFKGKHDLIILAKIHGKHFIQFTYWNAQHQMKCVLFDTQSEKQILKQCTLTQGTRSDTMYFVLFDQQHTVGTDISLPQLSVGFVSMDDNSTFSMTGQAVKRMRHLNAKNASKILTVIASTHSKSDQIIKSIEQHEQSLLKQNYSIFDRLQLEWSKRLTRQQRMHQLKLQGKKLKNYHPSDEYLVKYEYPWFSGKALEQPETSVSQEQQQGTEQSINVDEEKDMVDELFGLIHQHRTKPTTSIQGVTWNGNEMWTDRESIKTLLRMYPMFCPIVQTEQEDDTENVTWQLPSDDIIAFPFFGREQVKSAQVKEYTRLLFLLSQWVSFTMPSIDMESTLYEKMQIQLLFMFPRQCLFWIGHFFKQLKVHTSLDKQDPTNNPTLPEFRANLLRQDLYPWHKTIKIMVEMEKVEAELDEPPMQNYGKPYLLDKMVYVWMWGRSDKYKEKQQALLKIWKKRFIDAKTNDSPLKSVWDDKINYNETTEETRFDSYFRNLFDQKLDIYVDEHDKKFKLRNKLPDCIKAERMILIYNAIATHYMSIFVHIPDLK